MSDENAQSTPSDGTTSEESLGPAGALETPGEGKKRILLISYPKLVFLYPTFFVALIAGFVTLATGTTTEAGEPNTTAVGMTIVFFGVLILNFVVLTFDFPRTTALTLFAIIAMVVMGAFLTGQFAPDLLPFIGSILGALKPVANHVFFFMFAGVLFGFYLAVLVAVRYDYWEVRNNELLHHHGFLSDLKRYPAPNLRIDKEINDVFEYLLLRSGRLILHARSESRAIVLDNVLFINRKEELLTKMLGALKVSVRDEED